MATQNLGQIPVYWDRTETAGQAAMNEFMGRQKAQSTLTEANALGVMPSQLITNSKALPEAKAEAKNKFMQFLAYGMMGAGEGLTGRPFLTNFEDNRIAQEKLEAEGRAPKEWKPTTKEEALEFEKSKAEMKTTGKKEQPASIQRQKNLDTTKLSQKNSQYSLTNNRILGVLKTIEEIPVGALGSAQIKMMTLAGSKDPILQKWQDLKSLLSDIQLGKLQFTKGSISDNDMKFFSRASANDDIASIPMIQSVLKRALEDNEYDLVSAKASYEKNYEEDPDEFLSAKSGEKKEAQVPTTGKTSTGLGFTMSLGD